MISIDSYEVKRRWYSFWDAIRNNRWYRRRLIADFVFGMVVACDLTYFIFGWSAVGIMSGIVLGWIYFRGYERGFRAFNGSVLLSPKFGLTSADSYLLIPSQTVVLSCIIKLAWLKGQGPWWLWLLLLLGLLRLLRFIAAVRIALQILAKHEYYVSSARSFLHFAAGNTNPAGCTFDVLHDWVKEATGEDIDYSNVDIYKNPSE